MSVARVPAPEPAPARPRGLPPLPLLTLVNFFNYLDRQVVYGMTPLIREAGSGNLFLYGDG